MRRALLSVAVLPVSTDRECCFTLVLKRSRVHCERRERATAKGETKAFPPCMSEYCIELHRDQCVEALGLEKGDEGMGVGSPAGDIMDRFGAVTEGGGVRDDSWRTEAREMMDGFRSDRETRTAEVRDDRAAR